MTVDLMLVLCIWDKLEKVTGQYNCDDYSFTGNKWYSPWVCKLCSAKPIQLSVSSTRMSVSRRKEGASNTGKHSVFQSP